MRKLVSMYVEQITSLKKTILEIKDCEIPLLSELNKLPFSRLNIACGNHHKKGFINIDVKPFKGINALWDMTQKFPIPRETITEINFGNSIKHMKMGQVKQVMGEMVRMLVKGGIVDIAFYDFERIALQYRLRKVAIPYINTMLYGSADPVRGEQHHKLIMDEKWLVGVMDDLGCKGIGSKTDKWVRTIRFQKGVKRHGKKEKKEEEFEALDTNMEVSNAEFMEVPIEQIEANPWNPNEMDEATFNMLVDNLVGAGMNQTVLLTPVRDAVGNSIPNRYRLIDGEQRYQALKMTSAATIPAMIVENLNEDEQRFQTMRMNKLRGELNQKKFQKMVDEFLNKGYSVPELADHMGFTDEDAFTALLDDLSDGLDGQVKKEFDKVKHEIQSIDDLTIVLNKLFSKYGDTMPYNYMVLDFGGKKHLWVRMGGSREFKEFRDKLQVCQEHDVTVDSVLMSLIRRGLKPAFIDTVRAELKAPDLELAEDLNEDFYAALGELEDEEEFDDYE